MAVWWEPSFPHVADGGEDGPATEADRETIDLQTKMESGENGVELVTAEAM